ncbi:RusA family crossover junction endodeoxyribonuclease [Pseudanabaena sp. 'Roaring Creek']|uniref:RusA family crossover junction endodeoxyribonuclease n=1 Tax=Pseudanabaena sp. 'Roaring Creek' TaxID=1681830 RepID=UPI0006D7DA11|nr:RusA family crossover junction endodeoxyribonuclease [Pseudanabaena sp. 'Roaring Creek']
MTDCELRDWAITEQIKHLQSAMKESIMFRINGSVIAKERPRMNTETGTVYMPSDYMDWKSKVAGLLSCIKLEYPKYNFPLVQANIMYIFDGKHNRKQDGDNAGGSCADALVDANILRGDHFMVVPEQCMFLNHSDKRSPSTLIVLY